MITAAQHFNAMSATNRWLMSAVVLLIAIAGGFYAIRNIATRFRARNQVERVMLGALIVASSIAILTTVGIVASMLSEAGRFFTMVSPFEFFFGTVWDPRFAAAGSGGSSGQFGLIPLLAGTLYIAFVAMLFAVPIGLFAAIYMAEYASPRRCVRSAKPLLEVLAGIPTIVYGFFALVTVGPFLRDISAQLNGLVTGNYQNFIQAQSVRDRRHRHGHHADPVRVLAFRRHHHRRCRGPCATVRSALVPPAPRQSRRSSFPQHFRALSALCF